MQFHNAAKQPPQIMMQASATAEHALFCSTATSEAYLLHVKSACEGGHVSDGEGGRLSDGQAAATTRTVTTFRSLRRDEVIALPAAAKDFQRHHLARCIANTPLATAIATAGDVDRVTVLCWCEWLACAP